MAPAQTRILVTSLGSIGRRHLGNLRTLRPDAELGVLRLEGGEAASEFLCEQEFSTLAEALAFAPHCAIIASPAPFHVELASAFLSLGVPVLVEKPLSHSLDGVRELVQMAFKRRLPLMIGYNLRFQPSLAKARELLEEGAIGRVVSIQSEVGQYLPGWRPHSDYRTGVSARSELGGGALLELSHELDYVYWMFGMPDTIYCAGGKLSDLEIDVEDCVEVVLKYSNPSRLARIHLDFLQSPPTRSCRAIGTKGTLLWDGKKNTVQIGTHGATKNAEVLHFESEPGRTYLDEMEHFLQCVEGSTNPKIDGAQGYDVLAIVDAALRSMAIGIPITPERFY